VSRAGIVVIGRNEGERLARCLATVSGRGWPVVYVDSGSTDGSPAQARAMGCDVVELDPARPFSAARGRNEGFQRLLESHPHVDCVQFVDGDCELAPAWMDHAEAALASNPRWAAVCGLLRERHPDLSVYNRLCQIEWDKPVGEVTACGGLFMIRAEAFAAVGGFDVSVTAGEEPELCQRLRAAGWRIVRLDRAMAWHDSGLMTFRRWWRRERRTGYGSLDVARRFGDGPDRLFAGCVRSARHWAFCWPLAVLAAGGAGGWAGGPWAGLAAAGGIALLLPIQAWRLSRRARRAGYPPGTARAHAWLLLLGKFAQMSGQIRCWRERRSKGTGRGAEAARTDGPVEQRKVQP
jgi:GT2 family glycosyltransferase